MKVTTLGEVYYLAVVECWHLDTNVHTVKSTGTRAIETNGRGVMLLGQDYMADWKIGIEYSPPRVYRLRTARDGSVHRCDMRFARDLVSGLLMICISAHEPGMEVHNYDYSTLFSIVKMTVGH